MHKRNSQIYILAEGSEIVEQLIRTEPERFAAVLGVWPHARIVIEASTDSEWTRARRNAAGRGPAVAPPTGCALQAELRGRG